jgi:hypothetical protein
MVVTIFTLSTAGLAVASGNHHDPADCNGDPSGKSDTGHGANQGGNYDNTCPAGESQNGNGNGNANGKPCAGCVGNADDKNPPGQYPDGSDHNNGYECDGNSGIGKTNPAHTGCTAETNPSDNGPSGGNPPGNGPSGNEPSVETPPAQTPAVGGSNQSAPVTLRLAARATSVLGESLTRGPRATAVLGVSMVAGLPLPVTGIGLDLMLILGVCLVIVGMVAVRAGRRHSSSA